MKRLGDNRVETANAEQVVVSCVSLQRRLLRNWRLRRLSRDAPRAGVLTVCADTWNYSLHGAGVRFESSKGVCIDAHRAETEPASAIDAWSLLQYLESLCLESVEFAGLIYDASAEESLEQCLAEMEASYLLKRLSPESRFYLPTKKLWVRVRVAERAVEHAT